MQILNQGSRNSTNTAAFRSQCCFWTMFISVKKNIMTRGESFQGEACCCWLEESFFDLSKILLTQWKTCWDSLVCPWHGKKAKQIKQTSKHCKRGEPPFLMDFPPLLVRSSLCHFPYKSNSVIVSMVKLFLFHVCYWYWYCWLHHLILYRVVLSVLSVSPIPALILTSGLREC